MDVKGKDVPTVQEFSHSKTLDELDASFEEAFKNFDISTHDFGGSDDHDDHIDYDDHPVAPPVITDHKHPHQVAVAPPPHFAHHEPQPHPHHNAELQALPEPDLSHFGQDPGFITHLIDSPPVDLPHHQQDVVVFPDPHAEVAHELRESVSTAVHGGGNHGLPFDNVDIRHFEPREPLPFDAVALDHGVYGLEAGSPQLPEHVFDFEEPHQTLSPQAPRPPFAPPPGLLLKQRPSSYYPIPSKRAAYHEKDGKTLPGVGPDFKDPFETQVTVGDFGIDFAAVPDDYERRASKLGPLTDEHREKGPIFSLWR